MAKRKRSPRGKGAKVCSIIVDGETEQWYTETLRKAEGLKHLKIKPDLPKKKKLTDLYEYVKQQVVIFDKVIWIIDMDVPIVQAKKTGNLKEVMAQFKKERAQLEDSGVTVIVNTPSIEEWFLLHYESSKRYFSSQAPLITHLKKKHLPDYEKKESYYKKANSSFYQRLKPNLSLAIERSKAMGTFNPDNPESACCEMWLLFVELGIHKE